MERDDIYQERILEHFECPYHRGICPAATHRACDANRLCGDAICIELQVDAQGRLDEAWFTGQGCCVSQAAASMLVAHVEGKSLADVQEIGPAEMLQLFGPRLTPTRQRCCLLAWSALQAAATLPLAPDACG